MTDESRVPSPESRPSSPESRPRRFALVAGEASGDLLGAGLIESLRERFPDAEFAGIGGERMRAAGLDAWHDCDELAVMGLVEVLRHLPRLLRLRSSLVRRLRAWQPDVFIGIDAPDFNLGVEKRLKRVGIRTVHYVSPSVWAWREKRAAKIGRSADRVLCLFPIEPPIYARHGVDARFVGHPLADQIPLQPDRAAARHQLGWTGDAPVLAVLPGSRLGEIGRLAAIFLRAAGHVRTSLPGLRIVVPAANRACAEALHTLAGQTGIPSFELVDGRSHEVMAGADAVLLASGTAALEAMLLKRPMVVGYRIAPLTYWIVKRLRLLRIDRYSLPNILANDSLVPELMQDHCNEAAIAEAVLDCMRDERRTETMTRFHTLHLELRRGASEQAAAAVAESLLP
jgi:lipid-A-disaccharide synthase